jgi:peptidoglycan/LPS O-acetylase OafA/YrhL
MRKSVERNRRRRSRLRTYLYALTGIIIVCALIYWEQTALLYVVSTLVVCALLLAVAFADLEGKDRELFEEREGRPR